MEKKQNTTTRKIYQNAHNSVEVIVRPKRPIIPQVKNTTGFKRDCALTSKLVRADVPVPKKKIESQIQGKSKTNPKNKKPSQCPKTTQTTSKQHPILPKGYTWGQYLHEITESNASSVSSMSVLEHKSQQQRLLPPTKYIDHACQTDFESVRPNTEVVKSVASKKLLKRASTDSLTSQSIQRNTQPQQTKTCDELPIKQFNTPLCNVSSDSAKNQILSEVTSEQTPFGDSALQLLRKLRERLLSKGDDEGSEMINRIHAIFDLPNKEIPSMPAHKTTPNPEPLSFSPYENNVFNKETQDQIKVKQQTAKIDQLRKQVLKLQSLYENLLAYHEQVVQQVIEPAPVTCTAKDLSHKKTKQVDVEKQELLTERNALIQEVKLQSRYIVDLKGKLSTALSHNQNYPVVPSIQKPNYIDHELDVPGRRPNIPPPPESDVDSAFHEKTSSRNSKDSNSHVMPLDPDLESGKYFLTMPANELSNVSSPSNLCYTRYSDVKDMSGQKSMEDSMPSRTLSSVHSRLNSLLDAERIHLRRPDEPKDFSTLHTMLPQCGFT